MDIEQLEELLKQGEGYNLEFKESYAKDIATEVCAFANAAGGTLLIGVRDNGTLKGVHYDNAKASHLQDTISRINPRLEVKVEAVEHQGQTLVVITCPTGPRKPYITSGAIYVRVGPNTQKLTTAEEMFDFFQRSDRVFFDEAECQAFRYPEDFDHNKFSAFRKQSGMDDVLEERLLLENLQLFTTNGLMKNAGVLLFAKDVSRFVSTAAVRCLLFKGTTKRYILDDKLVEGSLIEQYQGAITYLQSKLELRYDIEGQGAGPRREYLELPEVALREAVLNALTHRDYYERGAQIMVEVYDNRVEVTNPGGLVAAVPVEQFGQRSFSRNPLVFGLLHRAHLIEKVGSGVARMRNAMQSAGLPPPVFSLEGIFGVVLYRPMDFDRWILQWEKLLTKNQQNILRIVSEEATVTVPKISEKLGIARATVEKNMQRLKEIGLLKRIGSNKTGSWTIFFQYPDK